MDHAERIGPVDLGDQRQVEQIGLHAPDASELGGVASRDLHAEPKVDSDDSRAAPRDLVRPPAGAAPRVEYESGRSKGVSVDEVEILPEHLLELLAAHAREALPLVVEAAHDARRRGRGPGPLSGETAPAFVLFEPRGVRGDELPAARIS